MRDSRLDKLAATMLDHSLEIKEGDYFHITADINGLPLVKAILRQARDRKAMARVALSDQEVNRQLLELIDPDDNGISQTFLEDKCRADMRRFANLAGDIVIRAYTNDQEMAAIPPEVQQMAARINKPFKDLVINNRKWVLFEYPTPGQAQRAGMSLEKYLDFVLDVSSVDYKKMQQKAAALQKLMQNTDRVRLTGKNTDLTFSIAGIPAIPCCGENNIPDGECFTAPVRNSVEGNLYINTPTMFWGKTFTGIQLTFAAGKIVKATADKEEQLLNKILDSDEGARYIGEFAIGFNPGILNPFCNTLFDEKITGSFHFTPGAAYDDAPNGNDSSIHWDLVHIQRPEYGGGSIWFDDREIRRDGIFIIPELEELNPDKLG